MSETNPYQQPGQYAPAGQQGYPPAPYGQNPYGSPRRPTNVLAIIALVASFVFPVAGIVIGHIALHQIKRTGEEGRGMALAGTIIGYALTILAILAIAAYIVFIVFIIAVSSAHHGSDFSYST